MNKNLSYLPQSPCSMFSSVFMSNGFDERKEKRKTKKKPKKLAKKLEKKTYFISLAHRFAIRIKRQEEKGKISQWKHGEEREMRKIALKKEKNSEKIKEIFFSVASVIHNREQ